MSRVQDILFETDAGGTQTLTIKDYTQETDVVYFNTNSDEAIDGSLRSNIRGFRTTITVSYELCTQPDVYRSICNNIATDMLNGLEFFYVGIDSSSLIRVVLDSDFPSRVEYTNQHGLFIPRLRMIGYGIDNDIDTTIDFEDWRLITEGVTEMRDYSLITGAVTTQIDYGLITD